MSYSWGLSHLIKSIHCQHLNSNTEHQLTLCVFSPATLTGVLRRNRLQTYVSVSVCVCVCARALVLAWQRESEWLTWDTCVTPAGGGWGGWWGSHSQSGRSLSECHAAAWRLLPLRQNTHLHLLGVVEERSSEPINRPINWGPTGNPLQSIQPLLRGWRNDTMAVALN